MSGLISFLLTQQPNVFVSALLLCFQLRVHYHYSSLADRVQVHRSVDYYIEKLAMLSSHAYKIEKVNRVKKFMGKYY